jgi:hypothetical protein
MGKTHRNVYAQSDSESMFGSPHNRGFAKTLKRHSHHSIRNKNKNVNEDTIIQTTCKYGKINGGKKRIDKIGNIPNLSCFTLDDTLESIGGGSRNGISTKWTKEDGTVKETINKAFDTIGSLNAGEAHYINYPQRYLNATKKQIERRGKMSSFTDHRKNAGTIL